MNCKPGDLAIVVKSTFSVNIGRIVKIVAQEPTLENCWIVDGALYGTRAYDSWLRPIRDTDGEDEMLRIAGKPANYKGKVVSAKPVKLEKL